MRFKKLIAIILAAWLPLFSGDALAVTVSMQSVCEAHATHATTQIASAQHHAGGMSCNVCGFCHLAGTGYLAISHIMPDFSEQTSNPHSFYPSAFISITFAPLDPPPISAA